LPSRRSGVNASWLAPALSRRHSISCTSQLWQPRNLQPEREAVTPTWVLPERCGPKPSKSTHQQNSRLYQHDDDRVQHSRARIDATRWPTATACCRRTRLCTRWTHAQLTGKRLARRSVTLARIGADYTAGVWGWYSVLRAGKSDDAANVREVVTEPRLTCMLWTLRSTQSGSELQTKLNAGPQTIRDDGGYNQPGRATCMSH
jgi:hypothetical protein